MSVILRNEYGAVAVNKGVIERMIIEDLLGMPDDVILCSKKGRIIREKSSRFMDPDYLDALEVYEKKHQIRVRVYIITRIGAGIPDIADKIFSCVEEDFDMLKLGRPGTVTVCVRGILPDDGSGEIIRRSIEVVRKNV